MRAIPYGISDFKKVISEYYYVDKTHFIPKLEEYGRYLFLIRPRRFGKSLFLNMLDFYYNKYWEREFELLKDTYIYKNPTELKNFYAVLRFDFSAIRTSGDVDSNFSKYCNRRMDEFVKRYNLDININEERPAHDNLDYIINYIKSNKLNLKIYILIDEYDNFMNDLLMNDKRLYEKLVTSTEAVYKEFFKLLKALTNENDAILDRMFITGVSPLALYDVTSGYNIGKNITTEYEFNDILGITENELEEIFRYYNLNSPLEKEELSNWYNNYKFHKNINYTIFNTDMILYYIDKLIITKKIPDDLVDKNVRSDYSKLKYLIYTNNKLNGNFNKLKELFAKGFVTLEYIEDSFSAFELTQSKNFISLLYFLGLITIDKVDMGDIRLKIPNITIQKIVASYLEKMLGNTDIKIDLEEFYSKLKLLAFKDELVVFKYIADKIRENTSIRDLINQESDIKMFYMFYFSLNRLYSPISEIEINQGYADIFLLKAPNVEFDIPNILIEFKFLKQKDNTPIDEALKKAREQLRKYSNSKKFKIDKKVILIFKGFTLKYCNWE